MATGMRVIGLLLTILAMGTPSVFASGFPGFDAVLKFPFRQTVTLFEAPGLKITGRIDGPSAGGIPDASTILRGILPRATITGTWVTPLVTVTSATELPLQYSSTLPQFWFPFLASPPTSASALSPRSTSSSPPPHASTPSPASSPSSPPPRASAPSSPPPRASAPSPNSSAPTPSTPPEK